MSTSEETKAVVRKMQRIIFGILCDIDDFCKEHDITYFLSGGTCLGAVRHQGFIPWDDDADLMMPRPDYERFLKLFPQTCEGKYYVGSLRTDQNWKRPFTRICDLHSSVTATAVEDVEMGVFVDVFPIDGLPQTKQGQFLYYRKLQVVNALRNTSFRIGDFNEGEGYRLIKRLAALFTRPIGPRFFAEQIDAMARRHSFTGADKVAAALALHYRDKETIEKQHMNSAALLPFEGRLFPVPVGYQQYLENLYGDYMTIPPEAEEKGYSHLDYYKVEFDNK